MKKHFFFLSLVFIIAGLYSCQKEFSFENGGVASQGSLQSDIGGDCLPKTVAGTYEAGTAVTANEYIEVQVNVTSTGSYTVYTDTLNGVFFRATGVFTTAGLSTIRLKATGTPVSSGIDNYTVTYGASQCIIAVTTLPSGAGSPAVFTLNGAPGTCMNYNLSGTYTQNVALTASNKVDININVTTIGTYNITTTVANGMTFTGSGALLSTGAQTITLNGSGTPAATGTTNIPVTVGSSTCSFAVPVIGPAAFTVNCGTAVVNGTYTENTPLDASNTINVDVNVTSVGGYTITGTIDGVTFTSTGNFSATGTQPVVLTGSGTPTAVGNFDMPMTGGTGSCNVSVTVGAGATIAWKFSQGATTFQGAQADAALQTITLPPPVNLTVADFAFTGDNPAGEEISIELLDLSGIIQANETYSSTSTGATNALAFSFIGANSIEYIADPSTTGAALTFKVTSHNTTTKTIVGTFSGSVIDQAGAVKAISNGTMTATYP